MRTRSGFCCCHLLLRGQCMKQFFVRKSIAALEAEAEEPEVQALVDA